MCHMKLAYRCASQTWDNKTDTGINMLSQNFHILPLWIIAPTHARLKNTFGPIWKPFSRSARAQWKFYKNPRFKSILANSDKNYPNHRLHSFLAWHFLIWSFKVKDICNESLSVNLYQCMFLSLFVCLCVCMCIHQ